ncbi:MAG: NADH-quinone oxidoreductase subunit A [Dehalococcoidia bacterium]|nr:NADH-quinone oxidoreductase subunit A [Dehalococcoidia bacterium]
MVLLGPLGVALAVFVSAIVAALLLRAGGDLGHGHPATVPERTPFAGGEAPAVHAWNRYHARYYVMALVFLAFDMEMVYMYPWAVVFIREGGVAMVEMGMFIAVLLLGVLYAWRERAFAWA